MNEIKKESCIHRPSVAANSMNAPLLFLNSSPAQAAGRRHSCSRRRGSR